VWAQAKISELGELPACGLGSSCCDAPDSLCVMSRGDTDRVDCDTDRVA
jgi:hypothetical protein